MIKVWICSLLLLLLAVKEHPTTWYNNFSLFIPNSKEDVGELGIRKHLIDKNQISNRIWEYSYNKRQLWQYGETTVSHSSNFTVSMM